MNTEWLYLSAKQLTRALVQGEISSRALLEAYIERVQQKNAALNAVVAMDLDAARKRADAADQAVANGENWGPLHGLPMTIKDTYEVPGMPCTMGSPQYRNHMPKMAATAAQHLLDAGAIIYAKTNVPLFASDLQSYNKVYGTTHNPWNVAFTPGGSSGGAAAALASGFTAIELGSDVGGSIRIPAHFCGVYGHKVTHGTISMQGHMPGPPGTLGEPDLAVAGPMARTAEDLALLMDVVAGPSPLMQPGWELKLPEAKQESLTDFRVLMWMDDPLCSIDNSMASLYETLKTRLKANGVNVTVGSPLNMVLDDFYPIYLNLLGSLMGSGQPKLVRQVMGVAAPLVQKIGKYLAAPPRFEHIMEGVAQSHADWMVRSQKRLRIREKFLSVFEQFDVILMPAAATTALKHQHQPEMPMRKITINGQKRSYTEMFMWISPATLMGLPATSAPIGVTPAGFPVNLQIMGAPFMDKTTIKFAELLASVMGGFAPPPGY